MTDRHNSAGSHFRRLRRDRKMTLAQAAEQMSISTAALSRMERGLRRVSLGDVESGCAVYGCTPWESTTLYNAAGFIPQQPPPVPERNFRDYAITLLCHLPYPAFLADTLMYVLAWNGAMNEIWRPPFDRPVHLLGELFAEEPRAMMGEGWRPYVTRAIWLFYHRSLPVATTPRYRRLLRRLREEHGPEFINLWNEALDAGYNSDPSLRDGGVRVHYPTPAGLIEYVVMQSMLAFPSSLDLYMYIPYGRANRELHTLFEQQVDVYQLYTGVQPEE